MEFAFKISLETRCLLLCSDIRKFLLPGQFGDDEESIDRLVAASSDSYACNSTRLKKSPAKYVVPLLRVNALP